MSEAVQHRDVDRRTGNTGPILAGVRTAIKTQVQENGRNIGKPCLSRQQIIYFGNKITYNETNSYNTFNAGETLNNQQCIQVEENSVSYGANHIFNRNICTIFQIILN